MADSREWFEVEGESFTNLEAATKDARALASGTDRAIDIFRVTRVPVRCIKREVSITETDIPVAREA